MVKKALIILIKTGIMAAIVLTYGCGGGGESSPPPIGEVIPPVNDALRSAILGEGMEGPSDKNYTIAGDPGLFYRSGYISVPGGPLPYYYLTPRLTLPTRFIVPNAKINSCYNCHRLNYSVPSANPQVTTPVNLPATEETGLEHVKLTRLTDDAGMDISGMWSPDGRYIAWVSNKTGNYQIWVMDNDGRNKRQVTQGPSIHGWHEWSPDGTRLVYWEYDESTGKSGIKTKRIDGSEVVTIVESQGVLDRPVWRPDGAYIAYAAEADGNWDIWAASSDGKEHYRLTSGPEMETNPKWSPDGKRLAYKIAPIGSYPLTIEYFMTFTDGFNSPAIQGWNGPQSIQMSDWSSDGRLITYTAEAVSYSSGKGRVTYLAVVGDTQGGYPVVLSKNKTLGDRGPVFSPDGRRVAFWAWDLNYRATLWIVNTDGTNLRQMTYIGFDMNPRWSPDGSKLLFESGRSGNMDIWVMSVD